VLLIAIEFDWSLFFDRLIHPDAVFARALATTVGIAVAAQFAGIAIGLVVAFARLSPIYPLKLLAYLYSLVIRGTPVIVQVFFIYYGANLFLGFNLFPGTISIWHYSLNGAIVAGGAALAINEGAYMSEIIRAGIQSIDPGQMEASKTLGMSGALAMRRIILPQTARVITPVVGNQFNAMLKTTSLLFFIGVYEIFADAQTHYAVTFQPAEFFGAAAVWYLALTGVWSVIQYGIERRLGVSVRTEAARRRRTRTLAATDAITGRR
jgi:polar amino acid transport system permease protein